MKKLLILTLTIYFSVYTVGANWYGNHAVSYTTGGSNRENCPTDGDTTGGVDPTTGYDSAPANNNSSSNNNPETVIYGVGGSGTMYCLHWDASDPTVTSLTYNSGWTRTTNQTVSFEAADAGGAGLSRYVLQMNTATNTPTFDNWGGWVDVVDDSTISGNSLDDDYTFTAVNNRAYRFRFRVYDDAGNQSPWENPGDILMIDTDPPLVSDIGAATPAPGNVLADDALNVRVDVSSGVGAPITMVQGFFERFDVNNSYSSIDSDSDNNPGNTSRLQTNWNIQSVDNDGSVNNGRRDYRFSISYVEDEAGNSIGTYNSAGSRLVDYIYTVYADTLNITTQNLISETLSSTSNVADGSQKTIQIQLNDQYGNKIIPVTTIGRTIDFHVIGNNNIRLNQYENSGSDSAIFVGNNTSALPVGAGSSREAVNLSSTSGVYDIPMYVYAPTNNATSLVPGSAAITGVEYDINNTTSIVGGDSPQGQAIDAFTSILVYAEPVYSTNVTGDLRDFGFVEGVQQDSSIQLSRDHSDTGISGRNIYLEFGGPNEGDFDITARGADIIIDTVVTEDQDYGTRYENNTGFVGTDILETFVTAVTAISGLENSFLATVIEYVLDGKTITYPSDIVNKDSYYGSFTGGLTQVGVRITGSTTSDNTEEIVVDQFTDDVRILGRLTKSSFRQDIDRNVYNAIRYITSTTNGLERVTNLGGTTWNNGTNDGGDEIFNETVLFFKNPSGPIEVQADTITGVKTLVVENGDIYITGNITNGSSSDILGMIAINGNIYIDPSVTDVEAVLYTNRSIISYNGTELDGTNATATDLRNQLYIYGSLFAENTIGGSRATPIECPFYINTNCTTSAEAQKYDFNYLRRYFIYDSNNNGTLEYTIDQPAHGGARSNGGGIGSGYEQYPVIVDYNPNIQQTPPPFFD